MHVTAGDIGAFHGQIVTEDHSVKTELVAQHLLQPELREPHGVRINGREGNVCRHNAAQLVCQGHKRHQIALAELRPITVIYRCFQMAVGENSTVPGKMFARGRHARLIHTSNKSSCYIGYQLRLITEGTITDNATSVAIHIEHRCKTDV